MDTCEDEKCASFKMIFWKKMILNCCIQSDLGILAWCYSQTCSNNHLYKTTTRLRRPLLSQPKQILIQLLLYKMTTCLTQSATTFFISQMKKYLPKTTATKLHKAQKRKINLEQQCIKNLWLYLLYCSFIKLCLMSLFNVYKNWTINKNYIEIFKIM